MKSYFDRYRERGAMPPDVRALLPGSLFADVGKLEVWRDNRRGLRIDLPDLGLTLTGAIDDLLQEAEKVTPLDFKTRGYPLKEDTHRYYEHQLDLYAYLLEENGFPTTGRGFLLFFWPDRMDDGGTVKFHLQAIEMRTDRKRATSLLSRAADVLRAPAPPERHRACAFCEFAHLRASLD